MNKLKSLIFGNSKHNELVSKWKNFLTICSVEVCDSISYGDFIIKKKSYHDKYVNFNVVVFDECPWTNSSYNVSDQEWIKYPNENMLYLCNSINIHRPKYSNRNILIGLFHYGGSDFLQDLVVKECETCGTFIDRITQACSNHIAKQSLSIKGYKSFISIIDQFGIPVINRGILDATYGSWNIPIELKDIKGDTTVDTIRKESDECYLFALKSVYKSNSTIIPIYYIDIISSIQSLTWNILEANTNNINNITVHSLYSLPYSKALSTVNTIRKEYDAPNGWIRNINPYDIIQKYL